MAGKLDAAALLERAEAETGLSDWGDPTLPERFALMIDKFNAAAMDDKGTRRAEEMCHLFLTTRLEFFEDRNRYPLAHEVIDQPMFATGEPRSGTTLMHALMSVDPENRALRFWEVAYPSPPPGVAAPDDPRRARADEDWRQVNEIQKIWLRCHPYNDMLGDGLPECERTWSFDFRVVTPDAWLQVPIHSLQTILPDDWRAQYRIHKMMLQQLQYARPKKRWVLKGFHGFRLEALFEAYPDARIVWLHRDPLQVAASCTMMMHHIYDGFMPVDLQLETKLNIERLRASLANTMANPLVDDPRIHHVRYRDFVKDPVGTVRGYYQFCGRELSPAGEGAMRDYLANNRADRHGKFHYSTSLLTDIGEDLDALNEEFRPYRERFGVELEKRD